MYESFYKFHTKPFSLVPDPEFLFLSTRHKKGLTLLEYGLYNRALFTVLTGEPGTGKTTLLNKILALNSGRFTVGVITTPHPDAGSLLPWVADAFGLDCPGQDTAGYFRALTAFLGRSFAAGEQVLLVVDEAHNLNLPMLEGLRLLSNINDGRQSSIQIILAGQPNLCMLLARSDMRQLAQRVAVDYALEPLNEDEASAYVQHRLRVAGGEPDLVTEYACALVHQLSGGNPRLINQLCDLALMYGFGEGADRITAALLWQAAVDRAHGGILPVVVDPRTILLDPVRLNQESQGRVPKPVPAPVPVPQDTPAPPVASVHKNGSKGGILPVVVDPRTILLDPVRLSQESQGRVPKPVPVPVPVRHETPPPPVAMVHKNASTELYREGLGLKQKGLYREALKKFEAAKGGPAYRVKASAQRKLMICLYLGLSTLIAAHIVNAFVAHELLVPDMPSPPLPSQDNAHRDSVSPQQLAQDMMTRGLFALPAEFSQSAGFSTGTGLGPPLEAAKKLLLHGTALGIGDEPMAIVQDQSNKEQKLLHLHDRVPNVGELVSIEQTRVLFQDRGQQEWLELAMLTDLEQARRIPPLPESLQRQPLGISQPARSTDPAGLTPVMSAAATVSSAGSRQPIQIIDRRELSKTLSDIPLLLLQAQPVVSMINTRFNGILLEAVRADGLYSTMGLQTGDVLKRVNGMELREPSMLITALEQMKNEHRVKLDIVRNETPRTLTYEIR